MWDPYEKMHVCDRCGRMISFTPLEFHTTIFTGGAVLIPKVRPEFMTGFGFKTPMFCFECAVPVVTLVMDHCEQWRKERDANKSAGPGRGGVVL